MNEASPWQQRLRSRVGLPIDWNQWPAELRDLPTDLEASSLTVPFSLPLLAGARQRRQQQGSRVLVGLNGPVGAGKSTLAQQLLRLAPRCDLTLAVASIDDLYLPLAERRRVLADNPFGVSRVPPGSHDVPLLLQAIEEWRRSGHLRLPRFNKMLADGEGDREGWIDREADVLVLEGWLIGCRALPDEALPRILNPAEPTMRSAPISEAERANISDPGHVRSFDSWLELEDDEKAWLPRWNTSLRDYGPLWDLLDTLWLLRPSAWTLPRRWRFQAEARQRRAGGGWLGARDLNALVRSSLASLPPDLYQDPLVDAASSPIATAGPDRATSGSGRTLITPAISTRATTRLITTTRLTSTTSAVTAEAVAVLDGQRRCRWCGLTTDWPLWTCGADQLSTDSASSATG